MSEEIEYKGKYIITIRRDAKMMKTFVRFKNRVQHPRVRAYMVIIGVSLLILPFVREVRQPGATISVFMGILLLVMALFRESISVFLMKDNPEVRWNEEITYIFGNTHIRAAKEDGTLEDMGSYSKIYRMWEDEKHFYVGMNEDDLLIFPKKELGEGDVPAFRDFILDKSGAGYRWQPAGIVNNFKYQWMQTKLRIMNAGREEHNNKKGNK